MDVYLTSHSSSENEIWKRKWEDLKRNESKVVWLWSWHHVQWFSFGLRSILNNDFLRMNVTWSFKLSKIFSKISEYIQIGVQEKNVTGTGSWHRRRPLSNISKNIRRRERTARQKEERATTKLIAEHQNEQNRILSQILKEQKSFHEKKLQNEVRKLKLREKEVEVAERRLRLEEAREKRATAYQLLQQQQSAESQTLHETINLTCQMVLRPFVSSPV